jgi:tight adherence protein B
MHPALLMLLTFLAVVLTIAGLYSLLSDMYFRDRSRISKRVDNELRKRQREKAQKSALFKNLGPVGPDAGDDEVTTSFKERQELLIEQSGVNLSLERLVVFMVIGGLILGAGLGLVRQNILVGIVAGLGGAALPYLYVLLKRKRRLDKMMAQLPDAFDLMARAIRAGQTASQALLAVADEFDAPIAAEFAYCYEQQNFGLPAELALRDMANRTGLLEIKIFVLAFLIQQQTGGNLAELLEKLAGVVRERFRIRGKIRALTAEGKFQAAVLLALPPALFVLFLILNRNYAQVLLDYPVLLGGMIVSEVLGALWIRKIVNFDY